MVPQSSKCAGGGAGFAAAAVRTARADETTAAEPLYRLVSRYWKPRFWPAWCLWLGMGCTARLPVPWALAIHRAIGRALFHLAGRRRRIVRRNLELCFPELTDEGLDRLCRRHFEALGASFAECAIAWLATDARLEGRFEIRGIEQLNQALQGGKGVILYTGHFTALEICGRAFKQITPRFACMFSRRSNELLDELQMLGRLRSAHELIASDSVRSMLRSLERNAVVWYAPDRVAHGGRNAALLPFFGEPAMTNIATSRIARLSGAPLIPFSYRRLDGQARYELCFHPPLSDFPSDDPIEDTRRLVQVLEGFIRACPEQYLWVHRRFKGRPPELPDAYGVKPERLRAPPPLAAPENPGAGSGFRAIPELASRSGDAPALPPICGSSRIDAKDGLEEGAPRGSAAGTRPQFSVVIPLNNEEPNVEPLLSELRAALADLGSYELIVVDDGSADATAAELRRFGRENGPLRLLTHPARRGQSTAIYNGIRAATADVVVLLDGDLQNDPTDVKRLLAQYAADADRGSLGLLIGHRVERRDSMIRRLSSRIANRVRARVLGDATPDTGCGLKLIRRSLFMQLPYFDHMHRFLPALVLAAGFRVLSVPVRHRPRRYGSAHYGVRDRLWVGLIDLAGVAWLTRRSRPRDFQEEAM